jgi:hypothetical protein
VQIGHKNVVQFRAACELDIARERLMQGFAEPDPSYAGHRPFGPARAVGSFERAADRLLVDLWVEDARFTGPWATHFKGVLKEGDENTGALLEGHYVLSDALVAIGVLVAMAAAGLGFAIGVHVGGGFVTRLGFVLGGALLVFGFICLTVSEATGALAIAIRKALVQTASATPGVS